MHAVLWGFVTLRELSPLASVHCALLISEVFSEHLGCLEPFTLVRSGAPHTPFQSCLSSLSLRPRQCTPHSTYHVLLA